MNKGWYPDPTGRFEQRFWNGARWTSQVHAGGHVTSDPYEQPAPPEPEPERPAEPDPKDTAAAASPLLAARELTFEQTNAGVSPDYDLLDAAGREVGTVRDVGTSMVADLVSYVVDGVEIFAKHVLEVRDADGRLVLVLRHGGMLTSTLAVQWPSGAEAGRIAGTVLGRRFTITAGGAEAGTARATNAGGGRVEVADARGVPVAEVEKKWTGLLRELTSAEDRYAVRLLRDVPQPLRALALVMPVALDQARFESDPTRRSILG